jgi:HTH-type transcriptional regulator/antitoxin MqsA
LRPRLISEVFEYGDEGDTVVVRTQDVPIEDCSACGESFSGPKAARIRHEAIGRAFGLLPPRDIRAIRERLSLSPEDFASLIGIGDKLLSQWEDGSVWQNRTADRLIRLLGHQVENRHDLESLIGAAPMKASESEAVAPHQPSKRPRRRLVIHSRSEDGL